MIGYGACDWNLFEVNTRASGFSQVGPEPTENRRLEPRLEKGYEGAIYRQEKAGGLWGWEYDLDDHYHSSPEIMAIVSDSGDILYAHETEFAVDNPLITSQYDRNGSLVSLLESGQDVQRLQFPFDNTILDSLAAEAEAAPVPSWAVAFLSNSELLDFIVAEELRRRDLPVVYLSEALVKQDITISETELIMMLWLRGVSQILYGYRGDTLIPLLEGKFSHSGDGILALA